MKINNLTYKCYKIILILVAVIAVNLLYVMYYYKSITFANLLTNFIITSNYIGEYFQKLVNVILEEELIKIIVVGIIVIYTISKFDLADCIKNFNSIEYKDLKIKKDLIPNKAEDDKEVKNNTQLEDAEITNKTVKINNAEEIGVKEVEDNNLETIKKREIEQLFIDCPFIVSIIDSYLKRKTKNITLNMNLIPYKIKLSQIDKVFEYQLRSNSVIITTIKKEVEIIVVDVFKDLQEKGIIYIE